MSRVWRAAVVTVSDTRRGGGARDPSGDLIVERIGTLPGSVARRTAVADSLPDIQDAVRHAVAVADLVVLTGGTGLGPRDVTPQALRPMLDYEVPGMAEAMRTDGRQHTPHAMLSRQVAGVIDGRLVLALPGGPRAVAECLGAVWPALPHALAVLRGDTSHPPDG